MTLNGHFALKSGPSSASNGLAFWISEKTIRKFAELYAYNSAQQKCSPATVMVMCYAVIHWGFPVRKRQTSELYSHSVTVITHGEPFTVTDVCR